MTHRPSIRTSVFESLESRRVLSGVELLADFNRTSNGEWIREFEVVGETAYFTVDDRIHGFALWRTDGTPENTVLVKDLRPDRVDPQIYFLTESAGLLYFIAADDPDKGYQLWRSDGTENGTQPIWQADSPEYWSPPFNLVSTSLGLFFLVWDDDPGQEGGYELWRTDGTPAGTVHVKDVQPLPNRPQPRLYGEVDGRLLFRTDDGIHGQELWSSDGTTEGTTLLVDMVAANGSVFKDFSDSQHFIADQRLYFIADADPVAPVLWTTDGTVAGTFPLKQFASSLYQFTALGDLALFSARNELTDAWELWRTDGTPEGTFSLSDGTEFEGFNPTNLIAAGDAVFFRAHDATHGEELWRTDGTTAGTRLLADLRPGSESSLPERLTATRDLLFLVGQDAANKRALWRVQLDTLDVALVYDDNSESRPLIGEAVGTVNERLFFTVGLPDYGSLDAFTDGTAAGTAYFDLNQTTGSSYINLSVLVGASMYGYALDYNTRTLTLHRVELATGEYTRVLDHIFESRTFGPNIHNFKLVNGVLTFLISWDRNVEVWSYDPVAQALEMQTQLPTHTTVTNQCVSIGNGVPFGNYLVFVAQGATGCEFWRTDATSDNTDRLVDSRALGSLQTAFLSATNERLFFTARHPDAPNEFELWTTDATPEGTMPFDAFLGVDAPIRGSNAFLIGDRWIFVGEDELAGRELWTSDGTQYGTHLIADINPGPADSVNFFLAATASKVFFLADDGVHGMELWVSNGTSAGTRMIRETIPGQNTHVWDYMSFHGVFDGDLIFTAPAANSGRQLWRTDGTDAGTVQLSNIAYRVANQPFPRIARPSSVVNVNGTLFFTASTEGTSNDELWISDGSPAGTRLYHDFDILDAPCRDYLDWPCWPVVRGLQAVNGELLLAPEDRIYGSEPFIVRRSPGDTNFDSVVDLTDLNTVRRNFGRIGENLPGDLTQDDRVDLSDLNEVRNHLQAPSEGNATASIRRAAAGRTENLYERNSDARSQITDALFHLGGENATAPFRMQPRPAITRSSNLSSLRGR